ncbi:MAG: hypothetical protein NZ888_06495 [Candidatus Nitrosocaldus sp.]|nr:hypothetical protein [Candidatus Nitrosocaldus sp.]MDW8000522.1 hypothetical protein [Candidatus Nitrosocaldus sp.]
MGMGWYELRLHPNFKDGEEEMLNLLYRVDEFAVFILRKGHATRILVRADDINAIHFAGIGNARLERLEWYPSLRYRFARYYRLRMHHALPIVQEVRSSTIYSVMEELDGSGDVECIMACYAKYRDEAYSISRWIMQREGGEHTLVKALKSLFTHSASSSGKSRRLSPLTESLVEKARWKMRLKHFHTVIALGADDARVLDMLEGALPYGLVAYKSVGDGDHESDLASIVERSSMLKRCILSDVELASIVALPKDASTLRLVAADTRTFTTGVVVDADTL